MNSVYDEIQKSSKYTGVEIGADEMAALATEKNLSEDQISAVAEVFKYLKERKEQTIVSTLLRMSRLPQKHKKTFADFDFTQLRGKQSEQLQNLASLSTVYSNRNLAFIGPQGVGKTHLAMAMGYECCNRGLKAYFLSASELNQKFTDARKYGHEGSTINGLVKPTCLIVDEVGRCVFGKENTRMFFDVINRRYNKEGPNSTIFTSNITPDKWGEFFNDDSSLLCALDRIFDDAMVFMISGNSYRGKKCETVSLSAGELATINR